MKSDEAIHEFIFRHSTATKSIYAKDESHLSSGGAARARLSIYLFLIFNSNTRRYVPFGREHTDRWSVSRMLWPDTGDEKHRRWVEKLHSRRTAGPDAGIEERHAAGNPPWSTLTGPDLRNYHMCEERLSDLNRRANWTVKIAQLYIYIYILYLCVCECMQACVCSRMCVNIIFHRISW